MKTLFNLLVIQNMIFFIQGCPIGYYRESWIHKSEDPEGNPTSEEKSRCDRCYETCATCDRDSGDYCLKCLQDHFQLPVVNKRYIECFITCPPGYYNDGSDMTCQPCHHSCLECFSKEKNSCTKCRSLETMWSTGECKSDCDKGSFKSRRRKEFKECQKCHESCKSCFKGDKYGCLECLPKFPYRSQDNSCVKECPLHSYEADTKKKLCGLCHKDCESCYGSLKTNCHECKFGFMINTDKMCRRTCDPGSYKFNRTHCKPCSFGCKKCSRDSRFTCEECFKGFFLHEDEIFELELRDKEMFSQLKGLNSRVNHHKICFPDCKEGFYLAEDKKTCQRCHGTCKSCSGPLPAQCSSCHSNMTFSQPDSTCRCNGASFFNFGNIDNEKGGFCQECHPSCQKCTSKSKGDCEICIKGYYLKNKHCVSDCGEMMVPEFKEELTGKEECLNCHPTCKNCSRPGQSGYCTSCREIYHRLITRRQPKEDFGYCINCFNDYEKKNFKEECWRSKTIKVKQEKESLDGFSSDSFSITYSEQELFNEEIKTLNKNLTKYFDVNYFI